MGALVVVLGVLLAASVRETLCSAAVEPAGAAVTATSAGVTPPNAEVTPAPRDADTPLDASGGAGRAPWWEDDPATPTLFLANVSASNAAAETFPHYPGVSVRWCALTAWSEAAARVAAGALALGGVRVAGVTRARDVAAAAQGGVALGCAVGARAQGELAARALDAGLRDLGDAAAPAALALWALRAPPALAPPASLRAAAATPHARLYHLTAADLSSLRALARDNHTDSEWCDAAECADGVTRAAAGCACAGEQCATVLLLGGAEAAVQLAAALAAGGVCASVLPLPPHTPAAALPARPLLLAARAPPPGVPATALAPPPCAPPAAPCEPEPARCDPQPPCPFEPSRYLKLADARTLAYWPRAEDVLLRFSLSAGELKELAEGAATLGAEEAARSWLREHEERVQSWTRPLQREVRVGALLPPPGGTHWGAALEASVALADALEFPRRDLSAPFRFKVEAFTVGCSAADAFEYVTDALSSEYRSLSALAGPACGAALRAVAEASGPWRLPVLGYTAASLPGGGGGGVLLAAGHARACLPALRSLLHHFDWRRITLLTEPAAGYALTTGDLDVDVVARLDLPENEELWNQTTFTTWAESAVAAAGSVVVVWVESARAARLAQGALHAAGLRAGAVWLQPAHLPRGAGSDADTWLAFGARWAWRWERAAAEHAWSPRWRRACRRASARRAEPPSLAAHCEDPPPPTAALLFDVLRLWAAALDRLLHAHTEALYDLHRPDNIRSLMDLVRSMPFNGSLTGTFEWEEFEGAWARKSPVVVQQRVGSGGEDRLLAQWEGAALRWQRRPQWVVAPSDGREPCAVGALAAALRTDCRAAAALLACSLLAAVAVAAAAALWRARARLQRAYREKHKLPLHDMTELRRECLIINRVIGEGAFGKVYGGHALLPGGDAWVAVAIKTLKQGATREDKLNFLAEAETMKRFSHPNVVKLLAVVTVRQPLCAVMEFMLYGDLKTYLLARRHLAEGADPGGEVSAALLTRLARDAARGLAYLASRRFVHRDLAARNCLVSARRGLKLGDFGMARVLYDTDYYQFLRRGRMPVRWMAPESVARGLFSTASDVWSLGVLLYETVTLGALPHQGYSNEETIVRLRAGHAPAVPRGAAPRLEGLLRACWRREPGARPAAAEVAALLADHPRLLAPTLSVPLDPLPLPHLPALHDQETWSARPASTGTASTWLSAEGAASPPPTSPPPAPASPPPPSSPSEPPAPAPPASPTPEAQPLIAPSLVFTDLVA